MDGQARTATELALEGEVTPSTASSHLSRLVAAKLLTIVRQGRHRYFRIADAKVATAIESLMVIAPPTNRPKTTLPGPREEGLRRARICYDHLAGEMGVLLLDRLRKQRIVRGTDKKLVLTKFGETWCERLGVDLASMRKGRRPMCRLCLDWSERRVHLAGALGAAVLDRMFVLRLASRYGDGRGVRLSSRGENFIVTMDW